MVEMKKKLVLGPDTRKSLQKKKTQYTKGVDFKQKRTVK